MVIIGELQNSLMGGDLFEVPKDLNQAYEAGRSFGEFQFQLRDLRVIHSSKQCGFS